MKQSQPLRIENAQVGWLGTTKSLHSLLWFVNNKPLESRILGYLAKYQSKYGVELYSFALQGNHYHLVAKFPHKNQSAFYRDFNARIAEALRCEVENFPGGPFVQRRFASQALPVDLDIEDKVFYCALQAVNSGLTEKPSEYPGYNSFRDAVRGVVREYKVVDWAGYNAAKRHNRRVGVKDYTTYHSLRYARTPGAEALSAEEYRRQMYAELERRRRQKVAEYRDKGHSFLNRQQLRQVKPGSRPKTTKVSQRSDYRPLVLCSCPIARKNYLEEYFSRFREYKSACRKYLNGEFGAEFPPGTYRPPRLVCV